MSPMGSGGRGWGAGDLPGFMSWKLRATGDSAVFSSPAVSDYLVILYTIPEFIPDGKRGRQGDLKKWGGGQEGSR